MCFQNLASGITEIIKEVYKIKKKKKTKTKKKENSEEHTREAYAVVQLM